jgi:alkylation response protein AidB-like acyl-CoA dehydrogenase
MRFALSEDQVDFRDAVRGLLADTCPPDAVRAAWGGAVGEHTGGGGGDGRVRAAWSALAEMGVLGLLVPEDHGGLGMTDEDLVPLLVECGRAGLPDPVSSTAYVAAGLLRDHVGDGAAAAWLPRIASGEATVLVGFEGSPNLPAAASADAFLMCDGDQVHLLRPADVQLTPLESVDGARALCRVDWDPAPDTAILSGEAGFAAVNQAFDRAALGAAAQLVGLGHRMLDLTVDYDGERKQFGVPVGSFQAVKHHLADAALAVSFAEPLVLHAANSLAHGSDGAPVHVSMAKARASEAAVGAASTSLQCHGAIGYTVEYDLHLFMKRAWALAARYGDADFHRRRVRTSLLG